MKSNMEILLMISVLVVNTDYAFSIKCYECFECPLPFNQSSPDVKVKDDCKWCASLSLGNQPLIIKRCADQCESEDEELQQILIHTYSCCDKDYCNISTKSSIIYTTLLLPLLIIYFYF
ncbi:unnamed protein product [Schistosoma turkestanicum]|nr:unnamed protein product [Schistosoma turkestanicum]